MDITSVGAALALVKNFPGSAAERAEAAKEAAIAAAETAEAAAASVQNPVSYVEQSLTDSQKAQARANIGAAEDATTATILATKAPDIGSYNRFDPTTVTENRIISKTGSISTMSSWNLSAYIPVRPGMVLYGYANSTSNFCLFDKDLNVVANSNNWSDPFTVPAGVYYIRTSFHKDYMRSAYLSTKNLYDGYTGIADYFHKGDANIAPLYTSTAGAVRPVGSLLTLNGQLYRATANIPQGGTILPGTNATATTVADELAALQARVAALE